MIPEEVLTENVWYLDMVCIVSLKKLRKYDKLRTKEVVSGLKKIVDKQYLKVTFLRNMKEIQQRHDTFDPSTLN